MPRGLDHIVHAVRDLDAAADFYERIGFTVGARNRHPWGTHNRIIQTPGFFIEFLTVAEPEKLGDDGIPKLFGEFNQRFLDAREGFSLLILESADIDADRRAFDASRIAASQALRFERQGTRPDGASVTVGFSLVFAKDSAAPDLGFAVCQQHNPDAFWNESLQEHANGVLRVGGAVLVADNPSDHHIFLAAFVGERDLQSTSSGITLSTPRGEIQVMTQASFADHFGHAAPSLADGPRLAALRLQGRDLTLIEDMLATARIPMRKYMGRVVVAPEHAFGAALVFEAAPAP
jgi:catechol 2,3-dioxygenase-like lactoylglutathione lyase family enzyme